MPQASDPNDPANQGEINPFCEENGYGAYEELPFYHPPQSPVTQGVTEFLFQTYGHHGLSSHGPGDLDGSQPGSSSTYAVPNLQSGQYLQFPQLGASSQPPYQPPSHLTPASSSNTRGKGQNRSRFRSPSSSRTAASKIKPIRPYPPTDALPGRTQAAPSRVPCEPYCPPGQCPSDGQTSLLTLSSPVPLQALLPAEAAPVHGPRTLRKLTPEGNQSFTTYFHSRPWISGSEEEPDIEPDDELVIAGLIEQKSKSRLYALISVDGSGNSVCRLRHTIEKGGLEIECAEKFKKGKDALAHVCDYFRYKAYKCQDRPEHPACDKFFSTKERRNDHFSKVKKPEEALVPCSTCKTRMYRRNHPRHHRSCKSTVPIPTEPITTSSGRQSLPKCGCA